MNEKNNIFEEEISLAPLMSLLEEAAEVAKSTVTDDKFSFFLHYDENQKDSLLAVVTASGAHIEADDSEACVLTVRANMAQLEVIKKMDCVHHVEAADMNNVAIAELNDSAVATAAYEVMATCSDCEQDYSTMATARAITTESMVSGNIAYVGAEQWFKFTAPKNAKYTIYSEGGCDTWGWLYDACGNLIISNKDYNLAGKTNFRIIRDLEAGATYYVRVTMENSDIGSYSVKVTEKTLVTSVNITPQTIVLNKGETYELPILPNTYVDLEGAKRVSDLVASVVPSDAAEQRVTWGSSNTNVLSISAGWHNNQRYYAMTAVSEGTVTLRAYDWNNHGKVGECTVYVGGEPVTGISLNRSSMLVSLDDTEQLIATITPSNARNKGVTWNSSNWNVVDVDSNGVITGLKAGTATISATTDEGSYRATCIVTVDKRPKVMVERDEDYSHGDEDYFNITFSNGKIWRSIGCDLALDENRSGFPLWNKVDCYDSFTNPEQRYVDNIEQTFSAKEIALIYRLDPLGIEYYMKNNACDDMTLAKGLLFKDDVYKAIFGAPPSNRFYFTINDSGQVLYGTYTGWDRADVYSIAETLFGSHVIFDWSNFWQSILTTLFEAIPGVSYIQTGVEIYQALFHAGSFWGLYSNYAKSKVEEYVTEPLDDYVEEKLGEKAHKCIGWANNLISMLKDATISAFVIPNLNDITIYNTIEEQDNYRVVFENYGGELSLKEIIEICES